MDKWETLERKEKKGDILLKMIAISGEMPANLPEKIVGSAYVSPPSVNSI